MEALMAEKKLADADVLTESATESTEAPKKGQKDSRKKLVCTIEIPTPPLPIMCAQCCILFNAQYNEHSVSWNSQYHDEPPRFVGSHAAP